MSDMERAVPALPFYLSQANTEFSGNGWASDILSKAKIPAPQWLSSLAGKSSNLRLKLSVAKVDIALSKWYGYMGLLSESLGYLGNIEPKQTNNGRIINSLFLVKSGNA
ncbi:MAG: hypothetical protein ACRC9H_14640, partial [Aeromonas veronii]